jgi:RNA polymerase sigma-70 factor, ECF subfamily
VEQTSEAERVAFEELYSEQYWALLRFAVRRSADSESARDLVADTFAIAWQRRSAIPADRSLPWLYKVAGNLLANQRRRDQRADQAHQKLGGYLSREHQAEVGERFEWTEALNDVMRAFGGLSHSDQHVLMLHAWEGLRGKDLATALGCSSAAAAVRLHRARHRLEVATRHDQSAGANHRRAPSTTAHPPRTAGEES